jgi:diguanylate cyclase (GGDEF)-like protein
MSPGKPIRHVGHFLLYLVLLTHGLSLVAQQGVPESLGDVSERNFIQLHDGWVFRDGLHAQELFASSPGSGYSREWVPVYVPGGWNTQDLAPAYSTATYALDLVLPDVEKDYGLLFREISGSFRIFLDGEQVFLPDNGQGQSWSKNQSNAMIFFRGSGAIRIAVEVENSHFRNAGITDRVLISASGFLRGYRDRRFIFSGMLLGILSMFFLFNLHLGLRGSGMTSAVIFSLMILMMMFRVIGSDGLIAHTLAPWIPMSILLRIEYASVFLIGIFALGFLHVFYHIRISQQPLFRLYAVLSGLASVLSFTIPLTWYGFFVWVVWWYVFVSGGYAIAFVIKYGGQLPEQTRVLAISSGLFIFTAVIDILYSAGYVPWRGWSSWGFTLMIAFQMINLVHRYRAQTDALRQISLGMEETVQIRTREINELNNELREIAQQDPLTGIGNRLKFNKELDHFLLRSEDPQFRFALVLADIDRFKSINDGFGHPEGDRVLVTMAKICREYLRPGDVVARWGGEEFALLIEVREANDCREVADRLRMQVSSRISLPDGTPVTASFGVGISANGDNAESILARADRALYISKNSGRNKVTCLPENIS